MKTDLAHKETALKIIQQHHPYLAHHSEEEILAYFQVTSIYELNTYIKQLKESKQHHDTPTTLKHNICTCTDSHGEPKNLYESEKFAQEEANTLSIQHKLKLSVYICPSGCGWHLTKR